MVRDLRRLVLALLCACATVAAFAQALEVIDLRHRPAEQVLPQVQAIVGVRGAVTGSGFKLFVRSDQATLVEIRRMLAAIDVPQRRLLISVRQVDTSATSNVEIRSGAILSPGNSTVVGSAGARSEDARGDVIQQVQALEGSSAFIRVGEQRLESGVVVIGGLQGSGATVVQTPVQADTGVYVVPHLNVEQVVLDIRPQRESFGDRGEIRRHALATRASGRLGEWIDLGATEAHAQGSGAQMLGLDRSSASVRMHVQVKVEELK